MKTSWPVIALWTSWALLSPAAPEIAQNNEPAAVVAVAPAPEAYVRVQSTEPGRRALETATRRLVSSDGKGPDIWLVGVTHLGSTNYYGSIQKTLDAQALVLFEGVGRPDFVTSEPKTDEDRVKWTQSAAEYLAEAYLWHQEKFQKWPASTAALLVATKERRSRQSDWLIKAQNDAWNHPWRVELDGEKHRIGSLGSDGKVGGEGTAADYWFDIAKKDDSKSGISDLQSTLAHALGLEYQLDAINYDRPHFRNSDMTMNELKTALAQGGASGQERDLMQMLEGMPKMGPLIQGFMNMVGQSPQLRAMVKAMMIEVLGSSDALMQGGAKLQGSMGRMMSVLITDRNRVVVNDLRKALDSKTVKGSLALFYGAGHMADLESTIVRELNYKPAETIWHAAFDVNMSETGVSDAQWDMLRGMIQAQMQQQMGTSSP